MTIPIIIIILGLGLIVLSLASFAHLSLKHIEDSRREREAFMKELDEIKKEVNVIYSKRKKDV